MSRIVLSKESRKYSNTAWAIVTSPWYCLTRNHLEKVSWLRKEHTLKSIPPTLDFFKVTFDSSNGSAHFRSRIQSVGSTQFLELTKFINSYFIIRSQMTSRRKQNFSMTVIILSVLSWKSMIYWHPWWKMTNEEMISKFGKITLFLTTFFTKTPWLVLYSHFNN